MTSRVSPGLVIACLLLVACGEDPVSPAAAVPELQGTPLAPSAVEAPFVLPVLVERAVRVLGESPSPEAAALLARADSLRLALERVHREQDAAEAQHLAQELRLTLAAVVVLVLGPEIAEEGRAFLAERIAEVERALGEYPQAHPLAELARALAELKAAGDAALGAGEAARAVLLYATGTELLLRFHDERRPVLPRLLELAVRHTAEHGGESAVTALTSVLRQLQSELHAALESGDRERARQLDEAVRRETARIVVQVLGTEPVAHTARHAAAALDEFQRRVETADGNEEARALLAALRRLQAAAATALEQGNPVAALDGFARILDVLRLHLHGF